MGRWSRRLRGLLTVLVAVVLLVGAVQARAADEEQPIRLSAGEQTTEGTVWRGSGDVVIRYQDITIRCDEMTYDHETMDLVATGNVVLDQGPRRFTAREMEFNLRTKTGTLFDGRGQFPPTYSFSGDTIEKLDATHYRLTDATFTTCDPEDPAWDFHVRRALIEEEAYARLHGSALEVQGLPVFYLPYIVWPVKRERAPGLLTPGIGYSERRGVYLGNALYLPLGRSFDTTTYVDLYSEGYYGLGSEWRWAPVQEAAGEITAYTLYDDRTGVTEWKVDGAHEQEDLLGFRMLAEVHELSDVDFFQEFERSFDRNTLRSLYSYVYLTRTWGPASVNLRADRRVTFLETGSTDEILLHQLPELEMRVRSTRLGATPLYWTLITSLNYFDVDRGGDLKGQYGRADLYPQLSYTLPGPLWLSVTPNLGGRGTVWSKRLAPDRQSYEDTSLTRAYLAAGVDVVGPSVSRVFDGGFGPYSKLKHLIEPRVNYTFVSDPEDEELIPRFDEVDSTLVTNKVRVTLANRLFARSEESQTAREIASLELYQEHSFSDPLNRGLGQTSQKGPLTGSLRLTPLAGITFDARMSWDTLFDSPRSSSLSVSLAGAGASANLTWYQGWLATSGERTSSSVRALLAYRKPGLPVNATFHLGYDIEKSELLQQQLAVNWEGSCWGISAEYRDLRISQYPTRDYRLVISLKGVGRLPEIHGSLATTGLN